VSRTEKTKRTAGGVTQHNTYNERNYKTSASPSDSKAQEQGGVEGSQRFAAGEHRGSADRKQNGLAIRPRDNRKKKTVRTVTRRQKEQSKWQAATHRKKWGGTAQCGRGPSITGPTRANKNIRNTPLSHLPKQNERGGANQGEGQPKMALSKLTGDCEGDVTNLGA